MTRCGDAGASADKSCDILLRQTQLERRRPGRREAAVHSFCSAAVGWCDQSAPPAELLVSPALLTNLQPSTAPFIAELHRVRRPGALMKAQSYSALSAGRKTSSLSFMRL
jgi:hypothetical protein